jgi:hypothetical protein
VKVYANGRIEGTGRCLEFSPSTAPNQINVRELQNPRDIPTGTNANAVGSFVELGSVGGFRNRYLATYPNVVRFLDGISDIKAQSRFVADFKENINALSKLQANNRLLEDWLTWDDFFMTRNSDYWNKFHAFTRPNVTPPSLSTVRKNSVKALLEHPNEYVQAVERMGIKRYDLFTKHGVDYADEFYNIIANFERNNSRYGLTKSEIYAIFGYTTNFFYFKLNNWLRMLENMSSTTDIKNILNQGLAKLPKWTGTPDVVRVIRLDDAAAVEGVLARYPVGTTVSHSEFISFGSNAGASMINHPKAKIIVELRLNPNNTKARDISDLADGIFYRNNPRSEILLPAGSNLFVKSVDPIPGTDKFKMILEER